MSSKAASFIPRPTRGISESPNYSKLNLQQGIKKLLTWIIIYLLSRHIVQHDCLLIKTTWGKARMKLRILLALSLTALTSMAVAQEWEATKEALSMMIEPASTEHTGNANPALDDLRRQTLQGSVTG